MSGGSMKTFLWVLLRLMAVLLVLVVALLLVGAALGFMMVLSFIMVSVGAGLWVPIVFGILGTLYGLLYEIGAGLEKRLAVSMSAAAVGVGAVAGLYGMPDWQNYPVVLVYALSFAIGSWVRNEWSC